MMPEPGGAFPRAGGREARESMGESEGTAEIDSSADLLPHLVARRPDGVGCDETYQERLREVKQRPAPHRRDIEGSNGSLERRRSR